MAIDAKCDAGRERRFVTAQACVTLIRGARYVLLQANSYAGPVIMRLIRRVIILLFALVSTVQAQSWLQQADCIETPAGFAADCGYVALPQDYAKPGAGLVQIFYTRIASQSARAKAGPAGVSGGRAGQQRHTAAHDLVPALTCVPSLPSATSSSSTSAARASPIPRCTAGKRLTAAPRLCRANTPNTPS